MKRYQFFISSTFNDLQEERQKVIETLLDLGHIPSGMERFQASNDEQWKLIQRVIDECDYYLVIVAGRYGTIHKEKGKSYTQLEYEYALKQNKPIIGFIRENIDSLPLNVSEHDKKGREDLDDFRELVMQKTIVKWNNSDELATKVSTSVQQLTRDCPAIGWIRADEYDECKKELEECKLKITELQNTNNVVLAKEISNATAIDEFKQQMPRTIVVSDNENKFNVPRFVSVTDSFGGKANRSDLPYDMNYYIWDRSNVNVSVGNTISITLYMDKHIPESEYEIEWHLPVDENNYARIKTGSSISHTFTKHDYGPFNIFCHIKRKGELFKHQRNDALSITYEVYRR